MIKKKMILCRSLVNKHAVRRETINGVEHVIVSSFTLPDDVVMNGGLYPAEEIANSFETLERTLAPVEHPVDSEGNFLPASDPIAISNFYAGAYNQNVTRENGRVHIEKYINVQEAMKTERGKRLLDRICELEESSDPRPIHTSVGLFLEVERLDKPKTNAAGDEYHWIGRNFVFDHDAILLDSVGAATPEKGVGIAVNAAGEKMDVERVEVNAVQASANLPLAPSDHTWDSAAAIRRVRAAIGAEDEPNAAYARFHLCYDSEQAENFGAYKLPFVDIIDGEPHAVPSALRNAAAMLSQTQGPSDAEKIRIKSIIDGYLEKLQANQEGISMRDLTEQLEKAIRGIIAADWSYVVDIVDGMVIFETNSGFFQVPYRVDNGTATVVGIPIRVERMVTYTPKTNEREGDDMKDLIINALKKAGVDIEGMDDTALLEAYSNLNKTTVDVRNSEEAITNAVKEAVAPLTEKVVSLEAALNAKKAEEVEKLAEAVTNSGKYPGLSIDAAKALPLEDLRSMAANCGVAHGAIPASEFGANKDDGYAAPAAMPE